VIRAGLAQNTLVKSGKALVLGNACVGKRVADGLQAEGLEPELENMFSWRTGVHLPLPTDYDAYDRLRFFLSEYSKSTGGGGLVHPGVSAWADRTELPLLCQELGLDLVSPPVRIVSLFSNKLNLLLEAEKAKVPHLVLSFDPIQTVREVEALIQKHPETMKFPFVLKAIRGGGAGIGVRVIHSFQDMEKNLPLWLEQLRSRFGEAILFPERYLEGARYVIHPFVRFADGSMEFLPIVDASLQYRFRKLMEICPSNFIDPAMETRLKQWTKQLADQCSYVGLGELEYLVEGDRAYVIEGLCRLNTGFHLWERVAGTSAVAWQLAALRQSSANPKPKRAPEKEWSVGLSVRIHSEDPVLQIPQPGVIHEISEETHWRSLAGAAELDWAVEKGQEVRPSSDGLIGLLWVGGRNRLGALQFTEDVLSKIWISGSLHTNERFLYELAQHPWVKEGIYHASFVDEEFIPLVRPPLEILQAAVAICLPLGESATAWTASGLKIDASSIKVNWEGTPQHTILQGRRGASGLLKLASGEKIRVSAYPLTEERWQVRLGPWWVAVRRWEKGTPSKLYALANGKVHSILFREGTVAPAHETLLLLESLQLLVPHAVPIDVKIESWNVKPGDWVCLGQPLGGLKRVKETPPKNSNS